VDAANAGAHRAAGSGTLSIPPNVNLLYPFLDVYDTDSPIVNDKNNIDDDDDDNGTATATLHAAILERLRVHPFTCDWSSSGRLEAHTAEPCGFIRKQFY
jgi:hypothetical protein